MVVSVSLLFPGTGSEVVLVKVAVLERGPAVPGGTFTVRVNSVVLTLCVVHVQVMVPVPPGAGVVQGLVGGVPPLKASET
ncbi:MAG TPA: hypothetical protein VNC59_07810, partial [Thermoanaerobaculia bacterium]|nr:hypothetical protein [Thermoanaerobaculia bacterium]